MITLNNEMNFYLTHDPDDVVREKGYLVQGGLKAAREEFPDLPLVCDSGYYRGPTTRHGRDRDFSFANAGTNGLSSQIITTMATWMTRISTMAGILWTFSTL